MEQNNKFGRDYHRQYAEEHRETRRKQIGDCQKRAKENNICICCNSSFPSMSHLKTHQLTQKHIRNSGKFIENIPI